MGWSACRHRQKAVFTLSRMENLSHAEIAERLGILKRNGEVSPGAGPQFLREYLRYPGLLTLLLAAAFGI